METIKMSIDNQWLPCILYTAEAEEVKKKVTEDLKIIEKEEEDENTGFNDRDASASDNRQNS